MSVPVMERGVVRAREARARALACWVDAPGGGPLDLGILEVAGPDAASFLHSQVTNEVKALVPGAGNLSARVTRSGHLVDVFSLHRLAEGSRFWLIAERSRVAALRADLDAFLFADDCALTDVSDAYQWAIVQGPACASIVAAFGVEVAADEGSSAPGLVPGSVVIRRSLGGDPGVLVAWPVGAPGGRERLEAAAGALAPLDEAAEAMEIMRIEAGFVRVGPDTPGRERRLHETGLEQQAVSYSKGCYLGQEVIARARTYGSVPRALRALVLTGASSFEAAAALLASLPAPGADAVLSSGAVIGQLASRTYAPVVEAAVVLAYLDRDHRTPGAALELVTPSGVVPCRVQTLPLFRAADQAARVAALYDRSIRVFADGEEERALSILEEALRIDPTFADGYEAVGVMLGRSGRWHEAIDVFRRLEEVAPGEPMVNTNLSLYFMKLGDKATAEVEASKATEKGMARAAAEKRGFELSAADVVAEQRAQRRADATRKRDMFRKVIEIDPEDPIAWFGLGNALSALEQWEEAESSLAAARRYDKKSSAVYLAHGKALEALGRRADAVEAYRAGMVVASGRGDLMPLKEMEHRVLLLG